MTNTPDATALAIKSLIGLFRRRWIQIILLGGAAGYFRDAINPDGIAYIQVARHLLDGQWQLAITGYWGPLFSWLLLPPMAAGIPGQMAARLMMTLSAVFFLESSRSFLFQTTLHANLRKLIDWSLLACCLLWSVENITPDLMLAGIYLQIVRHLIDRKWTFRRSDAACLGLWLALAYLTKSVALPVTVVLMAATVVSWKLLFPVRKILAIHVLPALLAAWIIPVLLWVAILSFHYQKPTFSTSARIVHATVGPGDVQRYPQGFNIAPPEPGRITSWEDPSLQPHQFWNPLQSPELMGHQISIILNNFLPASVILTSLYLFAIPAIALSIASLRTVLRKPRRHWIPPSVQRGCTIAIFTAVNVAVYLPTLLPPSEQRYFYAIAPLLAASTFELARFDWARRNRVRLTVIILAGGLLLPALARWIVLPPLEVSAFTVARKAAGVVRDLEDRAGASSGGAVVGNARLPRGRAGLYLAWYLDRPWFGGNPVAGPDELAACGADYLALAYDDTRMDAIRADHRFEAIESPALVYLRLFRILSEAGSP